MIERNLGSTQTTHLRFQSQIYLCKATGNYKKWKKTNIKKKSVCAMEATGVNELSCNIDKIQIK